MGPLSYWPRRDLPFSIGMYYRAEYGDYQENYRFGEVYLLPAGRQAHKNAKPYEALQLSKRLTSEVGPVLSGHNLLLLSQLFDKQIVVNCPPIKCGHRPFNQTLSLYARYQTAH
jgi:hypothetical protein